MTQRDTDKRMNKLLHDSARVFGAAKATPVEMVMVCTLIIERAMAHMPREVAQQIVELITKVRKDHDDDARA